MQALLRNIFLGSPSCLYKSCKRILGFQYCDVPVGEFWYQDIVIQKAVLAIQNLLCLLWLLGWELYSLWNFCILNEEEILHKTSFFYVIKKKIKMY